MTEGGKQGSTSDTGAIPARSRSNWTASRVIGMVFASIGGLIGLALLVGGIAVLAAYAFARDDDGYFNSDRQRLESPTYAITTEDIDLGVDEADWAPDELLGKVRVQVEGDKPVFVGIGSDDDVNRYLGDVAHDELIDFHGGDPELDLHEGRAPRTPPGDQDFWVAESEGSVDPAHPWVASGVRRNYRSDWGATRSPDTAALTHIRRAGAGADPRAAPRPGRTHEPRSAAASRSAERAQGGRVAAQRDKFHPECETPTSNLDVDDRRVLATCAGWWLSFLSRYGPELER